MAAKELFITQSTLSHQILQLENEQPLFHRNSHEVMLTEAGQTLLLGESTSVLCQSLL